MRDNVIPLWEQTESFTLSSILGVLIFSKRVKCQWSVEELSERSQVNKDAVLLMESGGNSTIFELEQVCRTLDIPLRSIAEAILHLSDDVHTRPLA